MIPLSLTTKQKKNKTFRVLVRAPRTCVTVLEVDAATKSDATKRARDIIKFNEQPVEWSNTLPFTSLGIHTEVLSQ